MESSTINRDGGGEQLFRPDNNEITLAVFYQIKIISIFNYAFKYMCGLEY